MNTFASPSNVKLTKGFGLIELLIATLLIATGLFALSDAVRASFTLLDQTSRASRALALASEGIDAVRTMRQLSWSSYIDPLAPDTPYYFVFTDRWSPTTIDPGAIDGIFTRTITLADVYRKTGDDRIVDVNASDAKKLDPGTKKVTASVSWKSTTGGTATRSLSTYVSDLLQN